MPNILPTQFTNCTTRKRSQDESVDRLYNGARTPHSDREPHGIPAYQNVTAHIFETKLINGLHAGTSREWPRTMLVQRWQEMHKSREQGTFPGMCPPGTRESLRTPPIPDLLQKRVRQNVPAGSLKTGCTGDCSFRANPLHCRKESSLRTFSLYQPEEWTPQHT